MRLRTIWGFFALVMASSALADRVVVFAEGYGQSSVAEHVARRLARARAFDSARHQCRNFGFVGEPGIVPGTGFDTAKGVGNNWTAHFYSDFECSDMPAKGPDLGPWTSQSGALRFVMLSQRVSWWQAREMCHQRAMRLADWNDIASNWSYLMGTTPVVQRLAEQNGCASACPSNLWTRAEKTADLAYEFSTYQPKKVDPRGAPKHWRYSVLCVY